MEKLMVIDGNSIVNRAFYGIRLLTNSEGLYTNAIYGFLSIIFKYMEAEKPTHICVAFDVSAPTFRHKQYDKYKANRKGMPDELRQQMPVLKEVLSAMNVSMLELEGYEADDIIGTVSKACDENKTECYILTGDKDDLQLASDNTKVMLITTRGATNDTSIYDNNGVLEKYGVTPSEFIDVKALMGDSSDNIPGVSGIGEKTALSLIAQYKSLDGVYENIDKLKPGVQKKLADDKDSAYLSKKLATIDRNVPLDIDIDEYTIKEYNNEKLAELFTRLGFSKFMSKLNVKKAPVERCKFETASLDELKKHIESPMCYCLTSQDGNYLFSIGGYTAAVDDLSELKEIFEGETEKVAHDAKKDIILLHKHGVGYNNLKFDTMIASYIIAPQRSDYKINDLSAEYLKKELSAETAEETASANAQAVKALYDFFAWELAKNNQTELYYDIELPLIRVLADMEICGFEADCNMLKAFGGKLEERIEELTAQIYEIAGGEININSPKQLGELLFEKLRLPVVKKTKTGYSTNAEVLEKLENEHEIIPLILEYRKLVKLNSTYVTGLMAVIEPDGRIHSSFNQAVTTTGRISSTEPNLQNIPIRTELGREIRRAFVAKEGCILLDADYSQIELRVLAHIANDENMINAFRDDADIHTITASEVFGVAPEFVTSEMRSRAKTVNFGIVYGIGEFSLAQDLKITRKEAKQYIEHYFKTYPGVKAYMDRVVKEASEKGFVTTLVNRRRYIPELQTKNFNVRAFGERVAKNAPIQGTAADIIKLAMVRVHKRLKDEKCKSNLILQVHDELLIETYSDEIDKVGRILQEEMQNAFEMSVPLIAEVGEGENWYDAK